MSYPVIALVGSPNVGKSTLFNRFTRTRDALVSDSPGLTRDRHYGHAIWTDFHFIVIDTAGIQQKGEEIDFLMADQSWLAVEEADVVLFLVDGRCGLHYGETEIAKRLRRRGSSVFVLVNKAEGALPSVTADFFSLGLGEPYPVSALHGDGLAHVMSLIRQQSSFLCQGAPVSEDAPSSVPCFAVVGQPNTGKSTFINALLGEDRLVVSEKAGTTRDAIRVDLMQEGNPYQLMDTAGIRKRHKVQDKIEKFSVVKALQAIHEADVVLFFLDASVGITSQDRHLAGYIREEGRAVVLVVNKWDVLDQKQRSDFKTLIRSHLSFFDFSPICYISARHAQGLVDVIRKARDAYDAAYRSFSTAQLTRTLLRAVAHQSPPRSGLIRPRLRYAHQGGHNPPVVVVHGSSVRTIPESYRRYLSRFFHEQFCLCGTPLRIEFKMKSNPYV